MAERIPALKRIGAIWLEEPFHTSALNAYASLAEKSGVKLAAGEGAHNFYMAQHLISSDASAISKSTADESEALVPPSVLRIMPRQRV